MQISKELIIQGASDRGGWNSEQIKLLGLTWPPVHGWQRQVIGRHISEDDAKRFLAIRGQSFRKTRKPRPLRVESCIPKPPITALDLPSAIIHTDGGCLKPNGRGAWAYVLQCNGVHKESSMAYKKTTNNRMEVMAAIAGLKALDSRHQVTIYSDSQYLVHAISRGWAKKWALNSFRLGEGKRPNWDLWEILLDLCNEHVVSFVWIRGHNGHEINEKCDRLATQAMNQAVLLEDFVYEKMVSEGGKW